MLYWLEIFGWIGSGAVIISLALASRKKFRWWNFTGSVLATIYNGIIAIWPFFAMNLVISLIDAYWLWRIYKEERELAGAEGASGAAGPAVAGSSVAGPAVAGPAVAESAVAGPAVAGSSPTAETPAGETPSASICKCPNCGYTLTATH